MSMIDEIRLSNVEGNNEAGIRHEFRRKAWEWYNQRIDEVILKIRILFWSRTLSYRDLRSVWERVFGSEPTFK
jgi:hypothetical protein